MKNDCFGALHAVDSLGRRLPSIEQVGPRRPGRYVGMFYFLTHGMDYKPGDPIPANIATVCREHPEAFWDFDHPAWGGGIITYWDEPLYGYYFSDDAWVIRKHVEMLTHADVDFLIFDTTNRLTFFPIVRVILDVLEAYRLAGWRVPQIVYYTNTKSGETIREVYDDLYGPGLSPELWFQWEGKPLIIGDPEDCPEDLRDFFTFRLNQWPTEEKKEGGFPWIDFVRPQRPWNVKDGRPEVVNVSIAQHPNVSFGNTAFYGEHGARGRSYHGYDHDRGDDAYLYGYNVSEQWDHALELDPEIIFFTGWNEWIAGRYRGPADKPILMIDQADMEFSRDIEPMKGGFSDCYYLQFCDYVRRYKGADPMPESGAKATIDIAGSFAQWESVACTYYDMPFADRHREHATFDGVYTNDTGRLDIDQMKMARDDEAVYFYVRTASPISPDMFARKLLLYIGILGREYDPHWQGYQYLANDVMLDGITSFLQTSKGGYRWGDNRRVAYRQEGAETHLRIPRHLLGIGDGEPFTLYFKWANNTGDDHTIESFYINGDTAPFGRFSYLYQG